MPKRATRRGAADEAVLADELLVRVGGLRRGLRRATIAPWPGGSLTGAQTELLRLVRRRAGVSVGDAAQELRLKPNTVSALVSQLVDQGLVVRAADSADRRVARLELTPDAQAWLAAWRDERAAVLTAAIERVSERDRRALAAALPSLERLVEALHADALDA